MYARMPDWRSHHAVWASVHACARPRSNTAWQNAIVLQ